MNNPNLFRTRLFCLILWCFLTSMHAQKGELDHLLKELEKDLSDMERLKVYDKLALVYTSVDVEKKFFYAKKIGNLARKLGVDSLEVKAYIHMGVSYGLQNRHDSAIYYFSQAYNKASDHDYKKEMARTLVNIGYSYDRSDRKDEAIKKYRQALEIFKQIKKTDKTASNEALIQCYINIGSLYYDIAQYKLAASYGEQALAESVQSKQEEGIEKSLFSLGNSYKELNDIAKARGYFQRGLELVKANKNPTRIALYTWGLGQLLLQEGNHQEALSHFQEALKLNQEVKNDYNKYAVLISIAETYLAMGQPDKAKPYITEAYEEGKRVKSKVVLLRAIPVLVEVYKDKREFKKALEYQSEFLAIQDSAAYERMTQKIVFEDFDRVRSENTDLQKDNSKIAARNTSYVKAISVSSVLLLLLALLLVLYYYRNRREKIVNVTLQLQRDEIASQNAELEQLNKIKNKFFSIVSHDLRSPIATLKMLFGLYRQGQLNEKELSELLDRLEETLYSTSVFLDNLLEWSKSQLDGIVLHPSAIELEKMIEENIHLMETTIRLKDLKVESHIASQTTAYADPNMINVVIRNLISNAVKFCNTGDSITIEAYNKDGRMFLMIQDSGPGISESDLEKLFKLEHTITTSSSGDKGHQIGLVLCKDMVEQNKGSIKVVSELGKGSQFLVELPQQASQS